MNGKFTGQSGLPFTVTTSGTATNTGASASRANVVPGVAQYPANRSVSQWFNPAAFSVPTAYNWGNSGRNILRGPDEVNVDSSAKRSFPSPSEPTYSFASKCLTCSIIPSSRFPPLSSRKGGVGSITSTSNTARQLQGNAQVDRSKENGNRKKFEVHFS